jgi:hypothetical protein
MKRIFWIILIVVAVILAVAYFSHRSARHAVDSGDVFVRDQSRDQAGEKAKGPDGQANQPEQGEQTGAAGGGAETQAGGEQTQSGEAKAPAADSIRRNPPNGMVFSGKGKYQVYRQGDITWRLNTETGEACILFATDAEWRKPRVYQHGCGGS